MNKKLEFIVGHVKKPFTTNLKDWTYIDIVVACISLIVALVILIGGLVFIVDSGVLWIVTLAGSVFFYAHGERASDDDSKMIWKFCSGICILLTFLAFFIPH